MTTRSRPAGGRQGKRATDKSTLSRMAPDAWWRSPALGALLVLLVSAVYWPTLDNGFIWDDDMYVQQNLALRTGSGLRDIWFKLGTVPQYYPLVHTTFWIEYHLWGQNPRGYHIVNLLIHATTTILVWRLLRRLGVPGAYLAAAIFAVHPVEVESVAWITERKNVLSCGLAVGAILAYVMFWGQRLDPQQPKESAARRWAFYGLALVLYVAALWSKTVTASVPAVLLVLLWWKTGRIAWRDAAGLAPFFLVGLLMAGVTVWMEKTHVGAGGEDFNLSALDRLLIAGRAAWFYAGKLFWPWPLIFFYPRWMVDASAPWQYLYPAAAVALLVALWLWRGRLGRGPLAAVLIFGGVLVPALGIFDVYPFLFSFVADHFQYHASIALIALTAASLAGLARRYEISVTAALCTAGVLLIVLGGVARERVYAYRDLETLYEDTLARNPTAWIAHQNLAVEFQKQGREREAVAHVEAAMRIVPKHEWARRVGSSLYLSDRLDEAEHELRAALQRPYTDRQLGQIHLDLGKVLVKRGSYTEAAEQFSLAYRLRPDDARAVLNLAEVQRHQAQYQASAENYRQYLRDDPQNPWALLGLSESLAKLGRPDEALELLASAARRSPTNVPIRKGYATELFKARRWNSAETELRAAIALVPQDEQLHNMLGITYGEQADFAAAIREFQAALAINPNYQTAADNLQKAQRAAEKAPR